MAKRIEIEIRNVEGVKDCTVELDREQMFTNRELHKIKLMSGVRLGEMDDAFGAFDNDLLVALASVALTRANKTFSDDALWDAPAGSIRFKAPEPEDDALPPAERLPDSPESESEKQPSSGESLRSPGDSPEKIQ